MKKNAAVYIHRETRCADGNFAVPANFSSLQTKRYAETHEIEVDYILETIAAMENNTKIKKKHCCKLLCAYNAS